MRAGNQDRAAHPGVDGLCQVAADHYRRRRVILCGDRTLRLGIQGGDAAQGDAGEQVADPPLLSGNDALNEGPSGTSAIRNEHLFVEPRRGGLHVRQLLQACGQLAPTTDSIAGHAHQLHMSGRAQQPVLQIPAHAVGDGQGNDQRCYTCGHTGYGNNGNNAHHRLAALGPQITHGDKKLEAHKA